MTPEVKGVSRSTSTGQGDVDDRPRKRPTSLVIKGDRYQIGGGAVRVHGVNRSIIDKYKRTLGDKRSFTETRLAIFVGF